MSKIIQKPYSPIATLSVLYDDPIFGHLALQASSGNRPAFQKIYDVLASQMYNLCLRYAGNAEDAEDWFQDGFLKLYRKLATFRADGSFEGWARRIFITCCLDGIKKRKNCFLTLPEGFDKASTESTSYGRLYRDDIFGVIRQLPKGYQTIVCLYFLEGYSHKQIGELLNISEESSRTQLFRGRALLKKKLHF